MLMSVIWWVGLSLEIALILRAIGCGLFLRYPTFFTYLSWVALADCLRYYTFHFHYESYASVYWPSQFISLILGYGVILELLRLSFTRYPGAARLARVLVVLVFVSIFAYVAVRALTSPHWTPGSTNSELERDLRGAQVAVMGGVLLVIAYFRAPLGKNLKGIILGYGLFLSTAIISLAARSHDLSILAKICSQAFYLTSLVIWLSTLWSYHPSPVRLAEADLGSYSEHAATMRASLNAVRTNLGKVARP